MEIVFLVAISFMATSIAYMGYRHSGGMVERKIATVKQGTSRNMAVFLSTSALLILLAGCSGSPSTQTPVIPTPLTLPAGSITSTVPVGDMDWTMYHRDNARTGYLPALPDPRQLTRAWNTQLDGAVYAEPLLVGGHLIVATEGDTLYSLNAHTGKVEWHTNVGVPVPLGSLPCGNIDPLGITGTPVYDPATGLVFALAEVSGPTHLLVGIDVHTGTVRVRRSADPQGMNPTPHQQRAALALSQGMVYIAYGGLYGDCGDYHGWVVASRTDGTGALLSYQVPTTREGGIWATPGPVVDASGRIFVTVGNGETTQGNWDHSDSVLRLSPTLQLQDGFAPAEWQQDNAGDADLGSMGPVLLPGGLVFADGKSGTGFLLNADKLGGVDGQIHRTTICHGYGGAATLGTTIFVPCTDGVRQVIVEGGNHLRLGWQAPAQVNGSPVIGGHTVYSLDPGGTLYALNSDTGAVTAKVQIDATSRFATPTLATGQVFVGTLTGVVAITIS